MRRNAASAHRRPRSALDGTKGRGEGDAGGRPADPRGRPLRNPHHLSGRLPRGDNGGVQASGGLREGTEV